MLLMIEHDAMKIRTEQSRQCDSIKLIKEADREQSGRAQID